MEESKTNGEILIESIIKAIYWREFTHAQYVKVLNILLDDSDDMFKANEICECLGISKRDNRRAIYNVLNYPNGK